MRNIEEIWLDFREGNPLSAEEEAVVRQYIADPQRQTFFHTLEAMSGGKQVRRRFVHNRQAGMDAILRRTRAVRRRRIGRWCTGIAAGVALLVGMMFFYHAQEHGREPVRLVERAKEEKSSARLTLANGEVVTLQGGRSGVIVEDDCRKVENSDQTLVYEQSGMMSEVGMNIVTTPVGSEYRLQLADGTKVYLNADSELSFPEIFQGATREVTLRGEAYFEVAKDSTRQFIVHTQGMQVMVLGPSFNISSYPEQRMIAATLEEGRIEVVCPNQERYVITPNEQVEYDKKEAEAVKREVFSRYFTSWKDGFYWFNSRPLGEVMETLAKWYGLQVHYKDEKIREVKFSGRLKRYDDYNYLLEKFKETGTIDYEVNGDVVTISRKQH